MSYNPNNPNGSATSANSSPVVIASDQSAVPVSGTVTANIGTVATLATAAKQDTGNTSVASIDTKTPALGQALAAASVPVVLTAAQITTLTPVSTVTANAGTNLNTSALALETGGNLASIKTDVDNLNLAQASTTSGQKGNLVLGAVTTAAPTYTTAQSNPLSLTTAGAVRVDGSATTQPVSGTVTTTPPSNASTNVAQVNGVTTATGTGVMGTGVQRVAIASDNDPVTVKQATAANLNATVVGTGTFVTQSTLAAETTKVIGTVNVAAAQSIGVTQATGTNLHTVVDSGTITAVTAITNALPTGTNTIGSVKLTDGTTVPNVKAASTAAIATDPALVVAISPNNTVPVSLASVPSHAVTNAGTFAVQATLQAASGVDIGKLTANQSVNVAQVNGVTTLMGNGVTGTGSQRVTVASDNTPFPIKLDQTTPGTTNAVSLAQVGSTTVATGNGVVSAGVQRVAIASDNTAFSVNATNLPTTTGGLTTYHLASAATTNLVNVKASAGQLYGYMVSNTSAAYTYLCFHNSASAPTAGASIFFKIGIPAGGAANVEFSNGIAFSSGISISTVTGAADSNTTAVAANDQIINLFYK